jgi:hypothetical protein
MPVVSHLQREQSFLTSCVFKNLVSQKRLCSLSSGIAQNHLTQKDAVLRSRSLYKKKRVASRASADQHTNQKVSDAKDGKTQRGNEEVSLPPVRLCLCFVSCVSSESQKRKSTPFVSKRGISRRTGVSRRKR